MLSLVYDIKSVLIFVSLLIFVAEYPPPFYKMIKGGKNGVGFPSYSGPTDHNIDNMNNAQNGENPDFAFYVEDSPWEPIRGKGKFVIPNPSKARDKRISFLPSLIDQHNTPMVCLNMLVISSPSYSVASNSGT